MKIKELIKKLRLFNDNLEVLVQVDDDFYLINNVDTEFVTDELDVERLFLILQATIDTSYIP